MSRAPMPDSASGEVPMPSSFDQDLDFWDEGRWKKLWRRLKEEPMVPFGLALTCYALWGATKSIRRGDKEQTNRFFRARVYAQAFTLLCIVAGSVYWKEDREKRKHYQGLLGEKRALEKREAWIRELEARDREEEVERKRRAIRKKARAEGKDLRDADVIEAQDRVEIEVQAKSMRDGSARQLLSGSRILPMAMGLWWSAKGP